jgi:two-component system cell cycle sensor histidine kinase PleC
VIWSVSALILGLMAWRITRQILFVARPLDQIASSIRQIAKNPREAKIESTNRRDEIGAIISAIAAFRDGLLDAERLKAELIENQIAAHSAIEANRAKSAFLANMSHELRTPLNAIIGFSDFMIQGLFGPMSPKYLEYSEHIHKSGLHLLDVISDILDMAKVEAGKFELNLEQIDFEEMVSDCVAMIARRARERNADVIISGTKGVFLCADRRALRQILLNLLSNAVKFCSDAGRIEVRVAGASGHLSIEIHDDGKGIALEHIARLGRPFEQVTENSNLARGGTGLGLALVYAMAEQHGGSVQIESRVGQGTIVRVKLPWIDLQSNATPAPSCQTHAGCNQYPLSAVS